MGCVTQDAPQVKMGYREYPHPSCWCFLLAVYTQMHVSYQNVV